MKNLKPLCLALPLALAATLAHAQDNTLKFGYANVQPNSSASDATGPFTPAGLSLDVRSKSTLFLSYTRRLTDQWDVEAAFGYPPTHDVNIVVRNAALPGTVQAFNGQLGARVQQTAPTVYLNYNFGEKGSMLRPFVGVGVNYTTFGKADTTVAGNQLNGGPTSLSLEDSWGLAAQLGLKMQVNERWSLTAALATAAVRTKLTSNTLGVIRTTDIRFRPTVFVLAAGFSF